MSTTVKRLEKMNFLIRMKIFYFYSDLDSQFSNIYDAYERWKQNGFFVSTPFQYIDTVIFHSIGIETIHYLDRTFKAILNSIYSLSIIAIFLILNVMFYVQ